MKSTLLFTFALFLTACSENSVQDLSETSHPSKAESVIAQVAIPTEALKNSTPSADTVAAATKDKAPINGHTIYLHKCASCHGKSGEKLALNKSQVISGWKKEQTVEALKGYQDGSYGSSMKAIMKGQVSALSDAQIQAVSEYIATL